jgi:ribosome assembly protein YihI (activator of Der GTPase)
VSKLDRRDQLELIDQVLAGLDSNEQRSVDQAWVREIGDRIDALRSGATPTYDADDVLA